MTPPTVTREDRERAANLHYIGHPTTRQSADVTLWVDGKGRGARDDRTALARHAAAFAAHRAAAVAGERERIAKMADAAADQYRIDGWPVDRDAMLRFAAKIRSGT